jgi:hypothetical protein
MSLVARAREGLAHRRWPFFLAALAAGISLPDVGQGFALDDYVRRAVGVPLSAVLFAASLLSGESGLSTALYLLSHALLLDPETRWARRVRALAPFAVVGLAWVVAYRLLHYGARGSTMYTDPGSAPLVYLRQAILRAPIFLTGSIGLPLASFFSALSARGTLVFGALSAAFCVLFARAVRSLPRAEDRFLSPGRGPLLAADCGDRPQRSHPLLRRPRGAGTRRARRRGVHPPRARGVPPLHLPLALAFLYRKASKELPAAVVAENDSLALKLDAIPRMNHVRSR